MYTFCQSIVRRIYYSIYSNNYKNQRQFKQKLRKNRKKVLDANIIGMTLFEAKLKVDPVQIWPCEIDGKELDIVQVGMTNRVVVVVQNGVITQIESFR